MSDIFTIANCNCLVLRKASRAVSAFFDAHLEVAGISTVQFGILAFIKERPGIGVQSLAEELVMSRTSLVRALQPLARDGYIAQGQAPDNSRKRALSLTAAGARRLAQADAGWREAQVAFEASFGATRAASLRKQLGMLAQSF